MRTSILQAILNNIDLRTDVPAWIKAIKADCADFDDALINEVFIEFIS